MEFVDQHEQWELDELITGALVIGGCLLFYSILKAVEVSRAKRKLYAINEKLNRMNEKLHVIGQLTRHDVRNKLAIIANNLYLAKIRLSNNKETLENLETAEKTLEQITQIFDFASAYEKLGMEKLSKIDVGESAAESARIFGLYNIKLVNECRGLSVVADSMIGARREFLDPVEMSLFNADVIRVLAATGAFRLVQIELDKVFADVMAGKTPKLPTIVVSAAKAAAAGHFSNPYAHAKAHAAYEMAASVADISVKGCFKTKEREKYIPLVAAAHEIMRAAARLADEARELEKDGDSVCRSPHMKDGTIGRKTKLHEKPV